MEGTQGDESVTDCSRIFNLLNCFSRRRDTSSIDMSPPVEMATGPSQSTTTDILSVPSLQVTNATHPYKGDDFYRMLAPVRGLCLIVNNINFDRKDWTRNGSDLEGNQLAQLFTQLGFKVIHIKDKTGDQILEEFERASLDEINEKADAFVGIILSHGDSPDLIYGIDHELVSLDAILNLFNNKNCPPLIFKPKMFFIQACRGHKSDSVFFSPDNTIDAVGFNTHGPNYDRLPTWMDTMVCHSTIEGYVSNRNEQTGSWFGDALIKVFSEKAHNTELNRLLSLVSA